MALPVHKPGMTSPGADPERSDTVKTAAADQIGIVAEKIKGENFFSIVVLPAEVHIESRAAADFQTAADSRIHLVEYSRLSLGLPVTPAKTSMDDCSDN